MMFRAGRVRFIHASSASMIAPWSVPAGIRCRTTNAMDASPCVSHLSRRRLLPCPPVLSLCLWQSHLLAMSTEEPT